jgi:hypothetical protein
MDVVFALRWRLPPFCACTCLKLAAHIPPHPRRRHTYTNTLTWLKQQGGPNYRITSLFQWNAGSWDFQGVRADSKGHKNAAADLVRLVLDHNNHVNGRTRGR